MPYDEDDDEVMDDEAQAMFDHGKRALDRMRQLILSEFGPLLRIVTRNPRLKVEPNVTTSFTDGKTISLMVPWELGETLEHDRSQCGLRDDESLEMMCPACRVLDHARADVFHESAHITEKTFQHIGEYERWKIVSEQFTKELQELDPAVQQELRNRVITAPTWLHGISQVDPWFQMTWNAIEDVYVNRRLVAVRPGTEPSLLVSGRKALLNGIKRVDGNDQRWSDQDANLQAVMAAYILGHGLDSDEMRQEFGKAGNVFDDADVVDLMKNQIPSECGSDERVRLAFKLIAALRRLGYLPRPTYSLLPPPPQPESQEDEDQDEDQDDAQEAEGEQSEQDEGTTPSEDDSQGESESDSEDSTSDEGDGDDESASDESDDDDGESSQGESEALDEQEDDDGQGASGESDDESEADEQESGESGDGSEDDDESEAEGDGESAESDEQESGESGDGSEADGDESEAESDESEAEGDEQESGESGDESEAEGDESEANGDESEANGDESEADGDESEAKGDESKADGDESKADGDESADEQDSGESGDGSEADDDQMTDEEIEKALEELLKLMMSAMGHGEDSTPDQDQLSTMERVIKQDAFDEPSAAIQGLEVIDFEEKWSVTRQALIDVPERIIAKPLNHLRVVFAENRKVGLKHDLKAGPRLDTAHLHRAGADDFRIFGKRSVPAKRDWFVLVGLDVSASNNSNGCLPHLKAAAAGIGAILQRLGVRFRIEAHTGDFRYTGSGYETTLVHSPIKTEDEIFDVKIRQRLANLQGRGGNLDGHSLERYRKLMDGVKATDKLIMYFTDGEMHGSNEEEHVLVRNIELCRQRRYNLLGIGYQTDSPKQYGLDTIVYNNGQDLEAIVAGLDRYLSR